MSHRLEPLGPDHVLDPFRCGRSDLDDWLVRHARRALGHGTRTYVLIEDATGAVDGYFALRPYLLEREEAPRRIGRGAPRRIPAILLAKLALHERIQGVGLGRELLVHALATIVAAARSAGGRVVIVDAIDEAAARFYRAHDFEPLPTQPDRLVMKLSTAARALGLDWP